MFDLENWKNLQHDNYYFARELYNIALDLVQYCRNDGSFYFGDLSEREKRAYQHRHGYFEKGVSEKGIIINPGKHMKPEIQMLINTFVYKKDA